MLPCPDLAGAAARFARIGFQVGARTRHPWGTENHVIQFTGAFLELIALAPDYVPLPRDDDAFPFAGFLARQADSRDPSGMVVLRADDATVDAEAFAAAGIGSRRMLHFSRDARAPDGTTRTVAFNLAFATARSMPDLGFFVCQQLRPENFWNPAFQHHPNGVTGLSGIVIVAETPSSHAEFLTAFSGRPASSAANSGLECHVGDGLIEVLTPRTAEARYGSLLPRRTAEPGAMPCLAALRFATRDLAVLAPWTQGEDAAPVETGFGWIVGSDHRSGPALVFESSQAR